MKPISPVVAGFEKFETVYGADQPEFIPLPALRTSTAEAVIFSRWRLSWRERLRVLCRGDVFLLVMTFGNPLQPTLVSTEAPKLEPVAREEDSSIPAPLRTPPKRPAVVAPTPGQVVAFGWRRKAPPELGVN